MLSLAPFAEAKDLYQAFLKEGKQIKLEAKTELDHNFFKDALCSALSSKEVEEKVWACMRKCTYNKLKIDDDTFEPEEAREDYFFVMFEVAKANVLPFTKGLSAKFGTLIGEILGKAQTP